MSLFRPYLPDECGADGYPFAWHRVPLDAAIVEFLNGERDYGLKDIVRAEAGHRCVRCGHPYRNGQHGNGEWSPCDERCDHGGPAQLRRDGFPPQFIAAPNRTFNAGRQLRYDRSTTCIDPASGRVLPPLRVTAQWRILTVHHLDGDKRNCRWWNLVALCQRCHLQIQGRVKMNRPWAWEHSDWMKPYVAGFYAFKYAGDDLSRVEVEARLDELLAFGRVEESVERMPL